MNISTLKSNVIKNNENPKKVLIALQYERLISPSFFRIISELPFHWKWMIRMHPYNVGDMGKLEKELVQRLICNYEMELTNKQSISEVLSNTDIILTEYSTTAIDGFRYKIPVLFYGKVAEFYFKRYKENKNCFFANKPQKAIDLLNHISGKSIQSRIDKKDNLDYYKILDNKLEKALFK